MSESKRPAFGEPVLDKRIRGLRRTDDVTNLAWLAFEYLCMALVIAVAVGFAEYREAWGLARGWNVPVFVAAIFLMGGLQHRLAGLGHESSHYTFMKNKFLNDFVVDIFCMFPLLTTIHFYRLFHMAHHQYTNDRERDPDLANMGKGKRVEDFPMSRTRFFLGYFLRAFTDPPGFLRYQWDYIYVNVFGKGNNVYMRGVPGGDAESRLPRLGTVLGAVYLLGFNVWLAMLTSTGRRAWIFPSAVIGTLAACAGAYLTPTRAMFRSPFRQPYSSQFSAAARMTFLTALMTVLAELRWATGGRSAIYVLLLWVVPLTTTFMLYMLLRDVYQHANADDGRLTNSRVFHCDPFTRWAVFVYGQDMHVPHHLFPAVPHYRLRELHALLKESHEEYAEKVVECLGTFRNNRGLPTILDVLSEPRRAPGLDRSKRADAAQGIRAPRRPAENPAVPWTD